MTIVSSARNWWLSSTNPSNANNERNVNTSGALNNNNASNSNGVVPDYISLKARNRVAKAKAAAIMQGTVILYHT